jgi:hypothetical protein
MKPDRSTATSPALLAKIEAAAEHEHHDSDHQTIRVKIAQGVQSLGEGRCTDGETFMARMDAELAELERQRRE